ELSLLSPAERQQLLAEWNDAATARPRELGLHQLFESQVERSPEALAVTSEAAGLTYRELDLASNRLARWLVASGVGPEAIVGVLFERSLEMVVALLGVLKAGGAYLPLDPSTPQERLGFFLADAAPRLVLTTSALAALVPPGVRAVCLDTGREAIRSVSGERLEVPLAPDALAYVIYTSGSTGQPKGVMNAHRGAVNRILWIEEAHGLAAGARLLQKTPLSFDVSVGEIFWPLAAGACLVLARPGGHRDPDYLVEVLAREEITNVHFVPSMLRVFLEAPGVERCAAVTRVLASGEALPSEVAARLFERLGQVELHNLYGPTEAAVEVSAWTCRREEARMGVPIGRPIANLQIHLLDRAGQPVPLGVPGELHIGGMGVGRGYLRRPELTAERFVPDPWSSEPGGRLYRTGDLARHRPDGAVDFLGRTDHQVKLRGFRIELGEIEAVLRSHPTVAEAVVLAREETPGDSRLVAYLAAAAGERPETAELRSFLASRLPDSMVPAAYVVMAELPLTASGKLDRRTLSLAAPLQGGGEGRKERSRPVSPMSPVARIVARIWSAVLRREGIFADDDFFALGGHSLLATRVASQLRQALAVEVPLRLLFERPTVAALAAEIERLQRGGEAAEASPITPMSHSAELPLSFAQQRLWFVDQLDPGNPAYDIPLFVRLSGPLAVPALWAALAEILRRHEALRGRFPTVRGVPVQEIAAEIPSVWPLVDHGALPRAAAAAELMRLELAEQGHRFRLERGPLLRAVLVRNGAEDHAVLLTLHHIAVD
ncbi:MAG TPA: amino acid adenylation domain-containing protein, partial [Thermoanaerobaculia bacterium]|nr:amino acid adenylation domain-containing protein [Thermoanaerobaculia bacterium]